MKLSIFVFSLMLLVLLTAAASDVSCDTCNDIDKAWDEIRDYLDVSIEDGGRFYNPIIGWQRESVYPTKDIVSSPVASTLPTSAPLCTDAGGMCVVVSKAGCATHGGYAADVENDCPRPQSCCILPTTPKPY
ncbi:hypothetical protein J4207_01690 [Candidatus Woesearchaeota archaeon]|nr:hypothetical protein [Candidatus Woesearchaeota archaeon]